MSFRCDFCHKAQVPRTTPRTVVTKTRRRLYSHEHRDFTEGREIVEEQDMCPTCYQSTPEGAAERFADGKIYKNVLRFS